MSEDLSRLNNVNIDFQFRLFFLRIRFRNINKKNKISKAIIKRIVQFEKTISKKDYKTIPIVINNFNRLSFLKQQIVSLHKRGYYNIYIIDNNSTYGPLLEFYKSSKIKVFYLNENVGFLSIWKTLIFEYFKDSFYVFTDSDIVLSDECPDDFMRYFMDILIKYPEIDKVGFGLEFRDLPDQYQLKEKVQEHEKQFWTKEVEDNVYEAMIDTTFALYRPGKKGGYWLRALRTGGKYIALHLPWYTNSKDLSEEDKFYNNSIKTSTHWTDLLNNQNKE